MSDAAFAEQCRAGGVWLASYPKSGNTWLRFVVFHLLTGRLPTDSRELDRMINSARRPDSANRPIKKTHALRGDLAGLVGPKSILIYMHRHPLDVMQSALNYAVLTKEIPAASGTARTAWVAAYIENAGNPLWREPPYLAGTWCENVQSWLAPGDGCRLTLSYEACLETPLEMIRAIADLLGVEIDAAALETCRTATSFAALRAFEQAEVDRFREGGAPQGRFTGPERHGALEAGVRFFNAGRKGSYRAMFTDHEMAAAWEVFGPVAAPLGYTLAA